MLFSLDAPASDLLPTLHFVSLRITSYHFVFEVRKSYTNNINI